MKKIAIIAFVGLLPLSAVYAQQDSTLNRTVVVENEYNPTVMDAVSYTHLGQQNG